MNRRRRRTVRRNVSLTVDQSGEVFADFILRPGAVRIVACRGDPAFCRTLHGLVESLRSFGGLVVSGPRLPGDRQNSRGAEAELLRPSCDVIPRLVTLPPRRKFAVGIVSGDPDQFVQKVFVDDDGRFALRGCGRVRAFFFSYWFFSYKVSLRISETGFARISETGFAFFRLRILKPGFVFRQLQIRLRIQWLVGARLARLPGSELRSRVLCPVFFKPQYVEGRKLSSGLPV